MSKRAFGYAFPASAPNGSRVAAGNIFGAPQPQVELQQPASPTARLRMPGQWPSEDDFTDCDNELSPTTGGSFFTTAGSFATAVACFTFTTILALPVRLAQRYLRKQTIQAVPVNRDGARKKRLLDAGPVDAPNTPTRPRARITRRGSPSHGSTTPPVHSNVDSAIFTPPPATFTSRAGSSTSFSNTAPPAGYHGTSASFTPAYTFPSSRPDWTPSPTQPVAHFLNTPQVEPVNDDSDDDDWSFSEVTSGTPPHNPKTGSPVKWAWNSKTDEFDAPAPSPSPASTPSPVLRRKTSPTQTKRTSPTQNNKATQLSPNAHYRILKRAPVTPLRRHLHRVQLRAEFAQRIRLPTSPQANHTMPAPMPPISLHSELRNKAFKASALKTNAESIAEQAHQASQRFMATFQAREARDAEIRAAQLRGDEVALLELADTVDEDLSELPDASLPAVEYENDLSFLDDAPTPAKKKRVQWTNHSGVKEFYYDERISEMLDSTLETIASSPARVPIPADDSSEEEDKETVTFTDPPNDPQQGSVDGWGESVDASLDESQISIELFADLQADLEKKLALAPPPPKPLKPLVSPLTEKERVLLDEAAAKTQYGKIADAYVVKRKISARDFGTLLPAQFNGNRRAWLNDEIVNEYLSILVGHEKAAAGFVHKREGPAPPVHAFTSHWFTSMQNGAKAVERWAGRVQLAGKQYLDADLILYPICDGSHWRLLAVRPRDRTIEYLDSLGMGGDKYVTKMREYLKHELKELYVAAEWNVIEKQRSSRQLNGSDCGVFTLLNALALLRDEEAKRVIADEGMLQARERIAVTLIAGQPTSEMD